VGLGGHRTAIAMCTTRLFFATSHVHRNNNDPAKVGRKLNVLSFHYGLLYPISLSFCGVFGQGSSVAPLMVNYMEDSAGETMLAGLWGDKICPETLYLELSHKILIFYV